MKKMGIFGIGVVIIIVVVVALIVSNKKTAAPSNSAVTNTSSSDQKVAATITYSDQGFSPSTVTVKSGDAVALKNTASDDVQFDPDPHPVHTDDQDLNVGVVSPGQTKTFTVTKKGSFGYHNHLEADETGKIVVQ